MQDLFEGISKEWKEILNTQELRRVYHELEFEINVCPDKKSWFHWARLTDLKNIKVIIIGQDPYHDGSANGLAFSADEAQYPEKSSIPASLKNIYRCLLHQNLIDEMPKHGDLTHWAKQGVLLINTALTTQRGKAGAHMQLWKPYIDELFTELANKINKCHVFLWGKHAEKYKSYFENHNVHTWIHPSPLAQSSATEDNKFIHCDHFKSVSNIDWNIYKTVRVFTDGSCFGNGKKNSTGGFGVYFVHNSPTGKRSYIGNCVENPTNIRMEGYAIYWVMKQLKRSKKWSRCEIYTDSMFWIDMYTKYMPNWQVSKFGEKANSDLTIKGWKLYQSLNASKTIRFMFVPSHNKQKWSEGTSYQRWCYKNNDKADRLAFQAASLPK